MVHKKPTAHDKYMTKREWLVDTAETPKDKKNLKADLAKLQAKYMASTKPKKVSYIKNVGSALKEVGSAYQKAVNASGDIKPGADARAHKANHKYDSEKGQLMGALLQGRRYDNKTGKQIKPKK